MPRRILLTLALLASPAVAREHLGVFGQWGAFSDPQASGGPRCYAIAMAEPSTLRRDYQPYATVGIWPRQQVRGQVHFRLSRKVLPGAPIQLFLGGQRYRLVGGGGDAWATDKRMDASIVAAMRSAEEMIINARGADGSGFTNTWSLDGAATAMDATAVGCARLR
jgi:hypothetical protein